MKKVHAAPEGHVSTKNQRRESLAELLREAQASAGGQFLPWREFMRLALYHPEWGYYSARIAGVGPGGDFTTAPALHDGLARAVVRWVSAMRSKYPCLRRAPILEIGAGQGHLAAACMRARPWLEMLCPYGIVEVSEPLRRHQQKLLRWRPVRWFSSVSEALRAFNGTALIVSNELVDAFPCSVWQRDEAGWKEWGFFLEGETLREVLRDSPLPDSSIFRQGHLPLGQRVETHETWRNWLGEWTPEIRAVASLTIDYGGEASTLYERRPEGSLRAYWKQQRITGAGIRARFGQQDLTADVNFTDLVAWSEALGWRTEGVYFLKEILPPAASDATDSRLRDPAGAGEAFRVMEQTFGLPSG